MKPNLLIHTALPATLLLALAACNSQAPEQPVTNATETGTTTTAPPTPPSEPTVSPTASTPAATEIPAVMQGRWGLVAADCEAGRADAKGLVTIGPQRMAFYESVGTLDTIEEQAEGRLRGRFSFTGEGMAWTRTIGLELQDGGNTLVRTDNSPEAEAGPLRYGKCK